jgi:hypothetical protein
MDYEMLYAEACAKLDEKSAECERLLKVLREVKESLGQLIWDKR